MILRNSTSSSSPSSSLSRRLVQGMIPFCLALTAILVGFPIGHECFVHQQPSASSWKGKHINGISRTNDVPGKALQLSSSSSSSSDGRPDLVDQTMFVAAIERVEDEIAKAMEQQQQQQAQDVQEQADINNPMDSTTNENNNDSTDKNTVYAIGRLFVDLPIDKQPELDLTESIGPLVLVTGVWGQTAEISGLQPFDTITQVTVGSSAMELTSSGENIQTGEIQTASSLTSTTTFAASTKGKSLEETAAILTAAAQHALQKDKTEIQLEINRLIEGYYAPPPPPSSSSTSGTAMEGQ